MHPRGTLLALNMQVVLFLCVNPHVNATCGLSLVLADRDLVSARSEIRMTAVLGSLSGRCLVPHASDVRPVSSALYTRHPACLQGAPSTR